MTNEILKTVDWTSVIQYVLPVSLTLLGALAKYTFDWIRESNEAQQRGAQFQGAVDAVSVALEKFTAELTLASRDGKISPDEMALAIKAAIGTFGSSYLTRVKSALGTNDETIARAALEAAVSAAAKQPEVSVKTEEPDTGVTKVITILTLLVTLGAPLMLA